MTKHFVSIDKPKPPKHITPDDIIAAINFANTLNEPVFFTTLYQETKLIRASEFVPDADRKIKLDYVMFPTNYQYCRH